MQPILLQDVLQPDQKKAVDIASSYLKDRRTPELASNWEFYIGNHWQKANGWIGAKPLIIADGQSQTMKQIEQAFVSENVIKEVVDRHVGGILGREPLWGFVPQKTLTESTLTRRRRFANLFKLVFQQGDRREADRFAQEADEALTVWWNRTEPRKKLKEALRRCLNEERVLLRLFVPRGLYDKNKLIPVQSSLIAALDLLHVDIVTSDKGGVFIDTGTQKPFAIYIYDDEKSKSKCVELSYVNELGQTVLQVLSDNPELTVEPALYDLQGRLWMHEMTRSVLITEQIRSEQRSLNLDKTMMMRNVNLAGNLERTIMNAERPKRKVRIADANQATGYREEIIDSDWLTGPGVTNLITGLLVKDKDGNIIGRADPNISYRDPVPIDTFVGTRRECRESILGQAQQLHVMISGDSTVSGRSREQARAEYRSSLLDSKDPLDGSGRWILEAPLWLAAQFCNRTPDFAQLRCDFDSRVEDGPISPEERSANREDVKAGLLSKETAMSRNGTEDTDAEKQRIEEDRAAAPAPVIPPPPQPTNEGDPELIQ